MVATLGRFGTVDIVVDSLERWRAVVEEIVAVELDALHELLSRDPALATELARLSVVVRDEAPVDDPELLGCYLGVPAGEPEIGLTLPPLVELYLLPHLEFCTPPESPGRPDRALLRLEVRVTLRHEIGHHLGLDHDRLAELGLE